MSQRGPPIDWLEPEHTPAKVFNYIDFFESGGFGGKPFAFESSIQGPVEEIIVLFGPSAQLSIKNVLGATPVFCHFKHCEILPANPNINNPSGSDYSILANKNTVYTNYGFDKNKIPHIIGRSDFRPPRMQYLATGGINIITNQPMGVLHPETSLIIHSLLERP